MSRSHSAVLDLEESLVIAAVARPSFFSRTHKAGFILREVTLGSGRVDLLLALPNRRLLANRLRESPFVVSSELELVILSQLGMRPTSIDRMVSHTGLRPGTVTRVLGLLMEKRLVVESRPGLFARSPNGRPVLDRVISIEAKLSKWSKALEQAFRNHLFSTETWVLMDRARLNSDRATASYGRLNVGLSVYDADSGELTRLVSPTRTRPVSPFYATMINEIVVSRLLRLGLKGDVDEWVSL